MDHWINGEWGARKKSGLNHRIILSLIHCSLKREVRMVIDSMNQWWMRSERKQLIEISDHSLIGSLCVEKKRMRMVNESLTQWWMRSGRKQRIETSDHRFIRTLCGEKGEMRMVIDTMCQWWMRSRRSEVLRFRLLAALEVTSWRVADGSGFGYGRRNCWRVQA